MRLSVLRGEGGWGVIARGSDGGIILAAAGSLTNLQDAIQAEAHALLKAIHLADQLGMGRVIFETVGLPLQQAITSTSSDRGALGVLFREAKYKLQLEFIEQSVLFCPRSCNVPAHVLAAYDCRNFLDGQNVWLSGFPSAVTRAVAADLAGPP